MKASEVIQAALDNHYRTDRSDFAKHDFMCHAIEEYLNKKCGLEVFRAYEEAGKAKQHFMPLIKSKDTSVLTTYLKYTDKRYAYYVTRFGEFTPFCVKMRVKFWNELIAELKENNL